MRVPDHGFGTASKLPVIGAIGMVLAVVPVITLWVVQSAIEGALFWLDRRAGKP